MHWSNSKKNQRRTSQIITTLQ